MAIGFETWRGLAVAVHREKMLHQRQQLREKRADQRKLVDELDQRFERLQLATFPVFS